MVVEHRSNNNGQPYSNIMNKHPYIMVVDDEEKLLFVLKSALHYEDEDYTTDDSSLVELNVIKKIQRLIYKISLMNKIGGSPFKTLTSREIEILEYVARGYSNKQIGHVLGISEQTVKNHIASIMYKLKASDRTHAVVLAIRNGWLAIEEISETRSEEELASALV